MSQKRDNTTPSCAVCQRRKVKCNRVYPCAACTKSGLECVFTEVSRERKKARRTTSQHEQPFHETDPGGAQAPISHSFQRPSQPATASRPPGDFPSPASDRSSATAGTGTARLIDGRYVNNHLYRDIVVDTQPKRGSVTSSDFGKPSPSGEPYGSAASGDTTHTEDDSSSGRNFVFDKATPNEHPGAHFLQLPAKQIISLWQTYLRNIDPVMKMSHAPTVQEVLLGQIGKSNIPKNEEALIAAVYFVSTVSLTEEECQGSLHDSRATLLQKFRAATENALSAAGFITSTDIVILQALILYLAGLRSIGEIQYVWSLMGLAIRIAGTIGLARDGSSFDLSPFETEMRRRIWWSLVYLDCRMAELVGQDGDLMGNNFDARPPANLNDVDLFAEMRRLPTPRVGPTEATYVISRNLCLVATRELQDGSGILGTWQRLQGASISTSEKQRIMETIERRFHEQVFKVCDPTVPLQWLAMNTAKTFTAKLRLVSRIPICNPQSEWETPSGYSENAFLLSMELVQVQLDLWSEPGVQQWRWHWQAHFQWYALTCLLRQTRLRHPGPETSRAWGMIKRVFEDILPTLEVGAKRSVLLDGIHALLNAAKTSQSPLGEPGVDVRPADPIKARDVAAQPPTTPLASVYRPTLPPFNTGYGSAPHNALLPGMATNNSLTPISDHVGYGSNMVSNDYAMLGFDLEAIDWVEFDRLASELIQQ